MSNELFGIPVEFLLFGATLVGVAVFHHQTLRVALLGLLAITSWKLAVSGFATGPGLAGLLAHLGHESVGLSNLFGLLVGFALLADQFERSELPALLPSVLPDDWRGGFVLLVLIFVLSAFLDNIAAAMIGGAIAHTVYRARLHMGFLVAIVAASNAGGSGSVVGDTTTTMLWIGGVAPIDVLHAYVAAVPALLFFGVVAAHQQHRFQPIMKNAPTEVHLDLVRLYVVFGILLSAVGANVGCNLWWPDLPKQWPVLGLAVWAAILGTAGLRRPNWDLLPETIRGSVFLIALVLCASMMPVSALPSASWQSTLGLGFVSAVFDNIPLTALAIRQGGYDWGMLAYAVGFGGSMLWFGSSAGVALCNQFPEARSVLAWLRSGWHVAVGYLLGFAVLYFSLGWVPQPNSEAPPEIDERVGFVGSCIAPTTPLCALRTAGPLT